MQKLLFYFIALFVLFFACSQNETTTKDKTDNQALSITSPDKKTKPADNIPVPTPIPPPLSPEDKKASDKPFAKPVPQAPKGDLKYPKKYTELGISKFNRAEIKNNLLLDNDQGKYGQRIKMNCPASFDEVMTFYKTSLLRNGWIRNEAMDKSHQDEDVTFFATNYIKDGYTLMVSFTGISSDLTAVSQILKED